MNKLPEMLLRWNVFEQCYDEMFKLPRLSHYSNKQQLIYIDCLQAAATRRGGRTENFTDSDFDEISNEAWAHYECVAISRFPTDKRIRNEQ